MCQLSATFCLHSLLTRLLALQIDALIKEDNLALGSMASYAEDEPTAQRELQSRLAAATRAFQALYHGDFGSEDRADMKVSVQVKTRVHALRQNVSLQCLGVFALHTASLHVGSGPKAGLHGYFFRECKFIMLPAAAFQYRVSAVSSHVQRCRAL